MALTLKD